MHVYERKLSFTRVDVITSHFFFVTQTIGIISHTVIIKYKSRYECVSWIIELFSIFSNMSICKNILNQTKINTKNLKRIYY